jgi:DNA-directed RNA polymerase subunit RPC12/RpoP
MDSTQGQSKMDSIQVSRRTVKIQLEPMPFKCEICYKKFFKAWNYNQHKKNHRGTQCSLCHKRFVFKRNLKKHVKLHILEQTLNEINKIWNL